MREQLIQYVELLFVGAEDAEDVKQEILQNTLDRFDDLVSQGKSPEAAYRLAISGIGDINEILGGDTQHFESPAVTVQSGIHREVEEIQSKKMRAVAVAMYILCPIPLFLFSEFGLDTLGLCFTLILVAAATALIMMANKKADKDKDEKIESIPLTPQQEIRRSIENVISTVGLILYFLLSFTTEAWYITWLMFPIISCTKRLAQAILDLKEVYEHET